MRITAIVETLVGDLGDKRRWRAYKGRANALPEPYRSVITALERYLTYHGAIVRGDVLVAMMNDLADLFEQAAADETPVLALVGDDPVGFAEEFLRNYADGQWIRKERARLVAAVDAAVAAQEQS